jgi:hypothetical protein
MPAMTMTGNTEDIIKESAPSYPESVSMTKVNQNKAFNTYAIQYGFV